MLSRLKSLVRRHLNKPFVEHLATNTLDVKTYQPGYLHSFGPRNPDKIFYVIWRENGGSGFFSNFSSVLCQIKVAQNLGMIPIVDFENFKTLYNADQPIHGTSNAWEYYFRQLSPYTLQEVYQSKYVVFCDGKYPSGFSYSITEEPDLYEVCKNIIVVNDDITKRVDDYARQFDIHHDGRIVGVHFRGQEMKQAVGHPFPPTEEQMFKCTDQIMERNRIDRVFLVSESQDYLDAYRKRYGSKVLATDSFRTHGSVNGYKLNPRPNHRYQLGFEVLVDASLLSMCTGLLCGGSNVVEYARVTNNHQYEFVYKIKNGTNSSNPFVARYLFDLKKRYPIVFGNFESEVLKIK